MKKLALCFFALIYSICIFSQGSQFATINGLFVDKKQKVNTVKLYNIIDGKANIIDSFKTDNGKFNFHVKENVNNLAALVINNQNKESIKFILEKGIINISIDERPYYSKAGGTPLNDLYQQYKDSTLFYSLKLQEVSSKSESSDNGVFIPYDSEQYRLLRKLGNFSLDFKKKNIGNPIGKFLFINELGNNGAELLSNGDSVFFKIVASATDDVRQHPKVIAYKKRIEEENLDSKLKKQFIGTKFTDYELQTSENKPVKIYNYIGKSKLLYIDFWASWCAPCMREMVDLKKIYEKYKGQGLEIIGISLDTNKELWGNAIKKIDAPWMQLSDLKGYNSQLTKHYLIRGVPTGILLNEKGEIVCFGISPFGLKTVIEKYL